MEWQQKVGMRVECNGMSVVRKSVCVPRMARKQKMSVSETSFRKQREGSVPQSENNFW